MQTGYTEKIDDNPSLTTEKWLTLHLVRAFGVCYPIREDRDYETVEEIEDRITKYFEAELEDSKEDLAEARAELKTFLNLTDAEWNKRYLIYIEQLIKHNEESIKSSAIFKKRHAQVADDLNRVRWSTTDKFTLDVVKFGLDQLKLVERGGEPFILKEQTFTDFKEERIKSAERTVEFRKEDVAKDEENLKSVDLYKTFLKTVHDALKVK